MVTLKDTLTLYIKENSKCKLLKREKRKQYSLKVELVTFEWRILSDNPNEWVYIEEVWEEDRQTGG